MAMTERVLNCAQCGQDFNFSVEDQQFHAERGYQDPNRCPTCRAERRANRSGSGGNTTSPAEAERGRMAFEPRISRDR